MTNAKKRMNSDDQPLEEEEKIEAAEEEEAPSSPEPETESEPEKEIIINRNFDTLVLSGGGVKGLFLLGALQYCYDNFLLSDIENFVGTSAGAMISFLMAIGYTPVDIITSICCNQVMEKMQHFDIFAMINNLGAASFTNISLHLERMTIDKIGYLPTFSDIKHKFNKNLVFITYNLTKSEIEYLSYETRPELPCLVALRMSSNLPLVFENFKYDNYLYTDGGIANNFGIDFAEKIGTRILGIYIHLGKKTISNTDNILEYIFKLFYIPLQEQQKNKLEKVDTKKSRIIKLSETKQKSRTIFDFSMSTADKLELFSNGYRLCKSDFEDNNNITTTTSPPPPPPPQTESSLSV
jgi:predicted acylesterase/phospholipase RssA